MPHLTHNQLAGLEPEARESALDALAAEVVSGKLPRVHPSVDRTLRGFEERFGMSTDEMLGRVASGALDEDGDIAEWLFWAKAARRDRVVR